MTVITGLRLRIEVVRERVGNRGINFVWQGMAAAAPWFQGVKIIVVLKVKIMNVSMTICVDRSVIKLL